LINLVTGGAGFLGSYLIEKLLEKKEKVICIDNLSTGQIKNISHLFKNDLFEFINHDVINPIEINCDRIWHLACPASPIQYQKNPINTTKTSFLGTYNMLGLALRNKARLFFASTSEVYGDPDISPQKESYKGSVNPIGTRSCYDEGKRVAESLCFDYFRTHNIEIRIARIFNTYGPKMSQNDGRVVSNFICQSLLNESITIYGDGNQTRSFCYVDDLINGFIKVMESNVTGPINLGNPNEITINQLANKIKSKIDENLNIVHKQLPQDDPKQRNPDITKAKEILNWEPKFDLDLGLDLTINYFKKVVQNEKGN
tara:strand:+ start:617 stop:1558 length:942 start_codon:yes stop_codon:yes gene_type:complete